MRRSPYSAPQAESHLLEAWIRSDREPLRSFKEVIGEGFKLTDDVVSGAMEMHLQKHIEGCKGASVARFALSTWHRDEGDGVTAIRVSLIFRTVDDLLVFERGNT